MQVLVQCDDPLYCDENLIHRVEGVIAGTLERFTSRISHVEAHLRDLNGVSGGRDKVCNLEARIEGGAAVTGSHQASTLTEAIHAAADKLKRLVAGELQQLDEALHNPQANPTARPL